MEDCIIFTSNEEEPSCSKCYHFGGSFDCKGCCGPEKDWDGYARVGKSTPYKQYYR